MSDGPTPDAADPEGANISDGLPQEHMPRHALVQPGTASMVAIQSVLPWLRDAGVPDAPRDARILMAAAWGVELGALALHIRDPMDAQVARRFDNLVKRRLRREPVSHLLGQRRFMTRTLTVTADVLDPRPETEELLRLALSEPFSRVLDLGVGSGAILCTLLAETRGKTTGVGVDITEAACQIAFDNATAFGVTEAADIFISDWFEWVEGQFDLIVSNPPYIAEAEMGSLSPEVRNWEPRSALTDGADGLSAYRRIAEGLPDFLLPGGRFLCEIGPTQAAAVSDILRGAGLGDIRVHQDLDGRDRVVAARKSA